jgi:hypothetical protein
MREGEKYMANEPIDMDELVKFSKVEEIGFRRGASHAVEFVVDLLCKGATVNDIVEFSNLIVSWRSEKIEESTLQEVGYSHLSFFQEKK